MNGESCLTAHTVLVHNYLVLSIYCTRAALIWNRKGMNYSKHESKTD